MQPTTIQFAIGATRADSLGSVGGMVSLDVPETYIKDTSNARVWSADLEGGLELVFKTYRHRSPFSGLWGRISRGRAEREYDRLCILDDANVPCCAPVVWGRGRDEDNGSFELIGTRRIPHAKQLKAFIAEARERGDELELEGLFKTIRQLHKAGVYHGSLTPNNIVVSCEPGKPAAFFVVDLPRAIDFPYDIAQSEMGWYDIVHFIHRTSSEAGRDACLPILEHYDFSPEKNAKLEAFLSIYQPTKQLRSRIKHQFGTRARLDRLLGRDSARAFHA